MATSLIDFVKAREGCKLAAYWDAAGQVWTIGYGTTGPDIVQGLVWTRAQCDVALVAKLDIARRQLLNLSRIYAWPDGAQDALTDFVYNEGAGKYEHSTLRRCVDAEDWDGVRRHLLDWEFAGGKRLGGLITRREGEAAMIGGTAAV